MQPEGPWQQPEQLAGVIHMFLSYPTLLHCLRHPVVIMGLLLPPLLLSAYIYPFAKFQSHEFIIFDRAASDGRFKTLGLTGKIDIQFRVGHSTAHELLFSPLPLLPGCPFHAQHLIRNLPCFSTFQPSFPPFLFLSFLTKTPSKMYIMPTLTCVIMMLVTVFKSAFAAPALPGSFLHTKRTNSFPHYKLPPLPYELGVCYSPPSFIYLLVLLLVLLSPLFGLRGIDL